MNQALRTIGYFTVWGTFYGFLIGLLSGATGWFIGLLSGLLFGTLSGIAIGLIIGIMTVTIKKRTFHQDIDLALYRRRLAAFNGLLVGIAGFCVLVVLISGSLKRPPRGTVLADFYPLIAIFICNTVILTALCVAYISSHYPDWIIQTFYSPDPPRKLYRVMNAFIRLWKSFFNVYGVVSVTTLSLCFYISEALESPQTTLLRSNAGVLLIIALLLSLGVFPLLTFYMSLGNAVFLTFVKRLFFDEGYFSSDTYHYKSIIMLISFFFTIFITAWPWTLAPFSHVRLFDPFSSTHLLGKVAPIILGLLMATHVSKTLALPDEGFDKAKRKEMESQLAL